MRDRSESTNASPVGPRPGNSVVPRANTTSASGHGAASADGIGAAYKAAVAATTAPTEPASPSFPTGPCCHATAECTPKVSKGLDTKRLLISQNREGTRVRSVEGERRGHLCQCLQVVIDRFQPGAHGVDGDVRSPRVGPLFELPERGVAVAAPIHAALHADGRRIPAGFNRCAFDDRTGLVEFAARAHHR